MEGPIVGLASRVAAFGLVKKLVRYCDPVRLAHKLQVSLQATLVLEGVLRILFQHG